MKGSKQIGPSGSGGGGKYLVKETVSQKMVQVVVVGTS